MCSFVGAFLSFSFISGLLCSHPFSTVSSSSWPLPSKLLMGPPEPPLFHNHTSFPSLAFLPFALRLPLLLQPLPVVGLPGFPQSPLGFPASSLPSYPTVLKALAHKSSIHLLSISAHVPPHLYLGHLSPQPTLTWPHASEIINSNIFWSSHNHQPAWAPGFPLCDVREARGSLIQIRLPPPGLSPSPHPSNSQR